MPVLSKQIGGKLYQLDLSIMNDFNIPIDKNDYLVICQLDEATDVIATFGTGHTDQEVKHITNVLFDGKDRVTLLGSVKVNHVIDDNEFICSCIETNDTYNIQRFEMLNNVVRWAINKTDKTIH